MKFSKLLVFTASIAGIVTAACSQSSKPLSPQMLTGTIEAPNCDRGTVQVDVTVRNEKGELIATARTGTRLTTDYSICITEFATEVPEAKFYQIKIGAHDGPPYSLEALRSQNFHIDLTLK